MRERADNRQAEPVQAVKCARSIHGCSLARLPLCSFLFFAQQHMMQPAESCSTLTHTHTHTHTQGSRFICVAAEGWWLRPAPAISQFLVQCRYAVTCRVHRPN